MHADRTPSLPAALSAERVTALLLTVPAVGHRLGVLRGTTSAPDLAFLVKQVRQRRWFEPDIGVTADPFGREGQDITVY